jgi:hypothetical protein
MAVTRNVITIWDVSQPASPIQSLIIPVETPRIQCAAWTSDGFGVFAADALCGVYMFRVAESPECVSMPEFFPTDFTISSWFRDRGQIEESNNQPVHKQPRNVLLDEQRVAIYQDYAPHSLENLTAEPWFDSKLKYAWLNEEIWLHRLGTGGASGEERPRSGHVKKREGYEVLEPEALEPEVLEPEVVEPDIVEPEAAESESDGKDQDGDAVVSEGSESTEVGSDAVLESDDPFARF